MTQKGAADCVAAISSDSKNTVKDGGGNTAGALTNDRPVTTLLLTVAILLLNCL